MRPSRSLLRAVLLPILLSASFANGAESISAPFGLSWGASKDQIEESLRDAHVAVTDRNKDGKSEAWMATGLVQPGLKHAIFYFEEERLHGIELQYEDRTWPIKRYDEMVAAIRRSADAAYGAGKLLTRSREPDADVMQTLLSYQWERGATGLRLHYFAAERGALTFRSLSLHYTGPNKGS